MENMAENIPELGRTNGFKAHQVTCGRFSADDYAQLSQEANEKGVSITVYCTEIIKQRHEKHISLTPEIDSATARLQAKIEVLQEENEKMHQRLVSTSQEGALNGLDNKSESVSLQIKKALADHEQKIELERLRKIEAEHARISTEHGEMQGKLATDQRFQGYLEVFGRVAPGALQGLAERVGGSLSGLLGGSGSAQLNAPAMTDEQRELFDLILQMKETFGEQFEPFCNVARYLADNPNTLAAMVRSKGFQQYSSGGHSLNVEI